VKHYSMVIGLLVVSVLSLAVASQPASAQELYRYAQLQQSGDSVWAYVEAGCWGFYCNFYENEEHQASYTKIDDITLRLNGDVVVVNNIPMSGGWCEEYNSGCSWYQWDSGPHSGTYSLSADVVMWYNIWRSGHYEKIYSYDDIYCEEYFEFPPSISYIQPSSAQPGESGYMDIVGNHFTDNGSFWVTVSGSGVQLTVLDSSNGGILLSYAVDAAASPGVRNITVQSDNGSSSPAAFYVD
jgi:hypothetical protein